MYSDSLHTKMSIINRSSIGIHSFCLMQKFQERRWVITSRGMLMFKFSESKLRSNFYPRLVSNSKNFLTSFSNAFLFPFVLHNSSHNIQNLWISTIIKGIRFTFGSRCHRFESWQDLKGCDQWETRGAGKLANDRYWSWTMVIDVRFSFYLAAILD